MIAVVRCCCVTMPFTVQRVLTARTQLAAILVLSGATIVVLVYTSVQIIIENKVTPSNITDSALFSRDDIFVLWNGTRLALFFSSFLVIFVPVVTLMIALKKSARFQRQAASSDVSTAVTVRSLRDTQIIKGIFQVLAISTLCNSRVIIIAIVRIVRPELGNSVELKEEYFYLILFRRFFFYYKHNCQHFCVIFQQ